MPCDGRQPCVYAALGLGRHRSELARTHLGCSSRSTALPATTRAQTSSPEFSGAVDELHDYLAGSRLGPARIVGHSLGGLAALELARAHPEDASALMIVDSLPYVGDIFVPGATIAQLEPRAKMIRDQMVGVTERMILRQLLGWHWAWP